MFGCCCQCKDAGVVAPPKDAIGSATAPFPACCSSDVSPTGKQFKNKLTPALLTAMRDSTTYAVDGVTGAPRHLNYAEDECAVPQAAPYATQLPSILRALGSGYNGTHNVFTADGTVDLSTPCKEYGFKNVQARAWHHGRFEYGNDGYGVPCGGGTKMQTKYRTLTSKLNVALTGYQQIKYYKASDNSLLRTDSKTFAGTAAWQQVNTVQKASGEIISTNTQSGFDTLTDTENGNGTITVYSIPSGGTPTGGNGTLKPGWWSSFTVGDAFQPWLMVAADGCTAGTKKFSIQKFGTGYTTATTQKTAAQISADVVSDMAASDPYGALDYSNSVTLTDTSFIWDFSVSPKSATSPPYFDVSYGFNVYAVYSGTGSNTVRIEFTLSDAYTVNEVLADASALADYWQLKDSQKYPARTDDNCYIAPFVGRNDVGGAASPWIFVEPTVPDYTVSPTGTRAWFDPAAWRWVNGGVYPDTLENFRDGAIVGAPLPAGYGQVNTLGADRGVFDLEYDNYHAKSCGGGSTGVRAISVGNWTPAYLPANAPKWTPGKRFEALTDCPMWPSPFVISTVDGIYLQKWIEYLVKPPGGSYNFARPYGADRFTLDETNVWCYNGSQLSDQAGTTHPANGSLAGYWGNSSGVYSGCTISGGDGTLTLGTKVADVPTGWTAGTCNDTSAFGKFRWFDTAPGLYGKQDCTASYDGTKTTFSGVDAKYLLTGDKIDAIDSGGSALGTNLTATRIGDTSFSVPGDYHTAAYVVPHFLFDGVTSGQKYYFACNDFKQTFIARTWLINLDDGSTLSTSAAEGCLPWSSLHAPALVCTPNTDAPDNSYALTFPSSIDLNTLWVGSFQQWKPDPFWQASHTLCNGDPCDETCLKNYIEARYTVRTDFGAARNETAPTPPASIDLNPAATMPAAAAVNADGYLIDHLANPEVPWVLAGCTWP